MPRLVRRRTFRDRLLFYLNPLDLALELWTYIEGYDWDGVQSSTSTPIGLGLNLLLFLARVNCSNTHSSYDGAVLVRSVEDGYFKSGGYLGGSRGGKMGYFVCTGNPESAPLCAPVIGGPFSPSLDEMENLLFYRYGLARQLWILSWILGTFSMLNAVLCFTKKKRYRMFESNIDVFSLSRPDDFHPKLITSTGGT